MAAGAQVNGRISHQGTTEVRHELPAPQKELKEEEPALA